MRDLDIRSALHAQLELAHASDTDTLVVDELGLCRGSVRADVAVVNGSLAGFEIKSDRDTLMRLPRQVEAYGRVFDYVTLVVGARHLEETKATVPSFWGISVASPEEGGAVSIAVLRGPRRNRELDLESVASLLWRSEALALLEANGLARGLRSQPRQRLWGALAEGLAADALCRAVRDALRAREGWRSGPELLRCGGS